MPVIFFTKCDVLEELYITKKDFVTKHPMYRTAQMPLTHNNIVIMDSEDPEYK